MAFWDRFKGFFLGKSETQVKRERAEKRAKRSVRSGRKDLPKHREEPPPTPSMSIRDQFDYIDQTVVDDALSWNDKVTDLETIYTDRNLPRAVRREAFDEWWALAEETFTPIEDFDWDAFREFYAETMPS